MTEVHPLGNTALRTPETFAKYHDNPKRVSDDCFICRSVPIRSFDRWCIIDNEFPYDAVAVAHRMLVPKRHVPGHMLLTLEESRELELVMAILDKEGDYDALVQNMARGRTFPQHLHLHLLQWIRI